MTALFIRLLFCCALISVMPPAMAEANGDAQSDAVMETVSRFSGKPVPRFESLRYSAVHGRRGPTLDQPILWRYEREGLPMLVLRETHGWRRVRDPDGDEVWMQARMLSSQRTAIVIVETELFRQPEVGAEARAKLKPEVIVELGECNPAWCEVEVDRMKGWVQKNALWGAEIATGKL